MAEKPISALPEVLEKLTGEEIVPIVKDGVTSKIFLNKLKQVITKESLGLDKVDNTPDNQKPVSAKQQEALDGKADKDHTHLIENVEGLEDALLAKAAKRHAHEITDVSGLTEALEAKADSQHKHQAADVEGIDQVVRDILGGDSAGSFVISGPVEW